MPISFARVLPAIGTIAQDKALLASLYSRARAITVIRDVFGIVRLLIEPLNNQVFRDDDAGIASLRARFVADLGAYFGGEAWFTNSHFAILSKIIDLARKDRMPAPWDDETTTPRWYIVERHVAKHLWAGGIDRQLPWPVAPVENGQRPAIVTFFSFKGGIGRTTALAGTAIALARRGHRIGVVDLDLEAPGLSTLFTENAGEGVLDYLIEKRVQNAAWSLRQSITQIAAQETVGNAGEPIKLLSAGTVDENYLEKLARIDFQHLTEQSLSGVMKSMIVEFGAPAQNLDFIFLDARAGFHDLGGFALSTLSHGAVLLAANSRQNWAGMAHAVGMLGRQPVDDRIPVVLVHGMTPPLGTPRRDEVISEFKDRAYDVFQNKYYGEDEGIPNANDTEAPFSPVEILWQVELRGDLYLVPRGDSQESRERTDQLATLLAASCLPIAEKICRMFDRPINQGEARRG